MGPSEGSGVFEYLVVGAGPAGLQAGYELRRAGRRFLILERGERPGTFFERYPRHRRLISVNRKHTGTTDAELNLRHDWNSLLHDDPEFRFTRYSDRWFPEADDMLRYLSDFAERARLPIRYRTAVESVGRDADGFRVRTADGDELRARVLLVATGRPLERPPDIPGAELAETYAEVSVDARDFEGQDVLIIGKGNSGFETADNLIECAVTMHIASPTPLTLAWRSRFAGHLRAVNNNFLDTYHLKSGNAVLDAHIEGIVRRNGRYVVDFSYVHANGERETLEYDRVILCTGFRFDDTIFDETCQPEIVLGGQFPGQTSEWESTTTPGLHYAGCLMHARDYKRSQSAFIHGFRYNVRTLVAIAEHKHFGRQMPHKVIGGAPEDIAHAVLERANVTSALWQQFGFLCDLVVPVNGEARYYRELPVDYVHEKLAAGRPEYLTFTMEIGDHGGDSFAIERHPDPQHAELSTAVHPVVRRYRDGELVGVHHVLENLHAALKPVWSDDALHVRPLARFCRSSVRRMATIGEP